MTQGVYNLIDAIASGDSLAIDAAFNTEMATRISERLDDMRVEVARNMFATESVQVEEEFEELDEASNAAPNFPQGYDWKATHKEVGAIKHSNFPETTHSKKAKIAADNKDAITYHKEMTKHHNVAVKYHEKHPDADPKTHGTESGHSNAHEHHDYNYSGIK